MQTYCRADPLSIEPWIALQADYASNPYLLTQNERSQSDVAVLVNSPLRYDVDAMHYALTPKIRYSDSGTYGSLDSNYFHLDGSAQLLSERSSLTLIGGFGRDSSLYHNGLTANGVGVRTDVSSAGLTWERSLSERLLLDLASGWSRALYGNGARAEGLDDYRYETFSPSVKWSASERDSVNVTGSVGSYKTLDGLTFSKIYNLELGYDRRLTELWKLSASVGYSRSDNAVQEFFGPLFLGNATSSQSGAIYKASLVRTAEHCDVTFGASRAFLPSGFAFLSRQDSAELGVHYQWSERWTFSASGNFERTVDPSANGTTASRRFFSAEISAGWYWNEHLILSLHASQVSQSYELERMTANSTGVSLQLARQFARIDL